MPDDRCYFLKLNIRHIRTKKKQKQHYSKLESIRGQMNPHFIFNSLNSINYFIARATGCPPTLYFKFFQTYQGFLNNMSHEYISLSDEIDSIEDYLNSISAIW
jgi:LytS/YehU family sensor histidine kinase